MAWGDPGGPSDSDMGSGNFGGMDGHGSFGGSIATEGPGRGYGGGHSNGSSGSGRGLLSSELGTVGPGEGYGGGHASTDAGGGAAGGTVRGQTRAAREEAAPASSFDSITNGAIASFTSQVDATPVDGFSGQVDARAMSTARQTEMAQQNIAEQASPGVFGRTVATVTGLANPVAGMAVDTAARGYNASQAAREHNAEFGTNVDTGLASNIGRQAVGAVGGLAGSRTGGLLGSRMGAAAGLPGAIAGGLLGSIGGQNLGRSVAMGGFDGSGSTPGTGMGGDGYSSMLTGQPSPGLTGQPVASLATASHGPVDFDGYASYAASFFS